MEGRKDPTLALARKLAPTPAYPDAGANGDSRLEVAVVYTSLKTTLGALQEAGRLAAQLSTRITLVVPQIVPFPLPLASPPVLLDFSEKRFRVLARESRVETSVRLYLCREREDALRMALKPRSLVLIGTRKRWWPTVERRLAAQLRRAGHQVMVIDTK